MQTENVSSKFRTNCKCKLYTLCSTGCDRWLILICCVRKILLAGWWFDVREKYSWLVAAEQSDSVQISVLFS